MGRELKRVPLNFEWPINEIWKGYINPHYKPCPNPECDTGYTPARKWLQAIVHLLMMLGPAATKRERLHPWLEELPLRPKFLPNDEAIKLCNSLAGREPSFLGHDSCDNWNAEKKVIKAAGLNPDKWGICPTCKGDAIDPKAKRKYNAWKDYDPPKGDGYQLWTTTNEGAPISPVFKTLDELCAYAETNCTTFGYSKTSAAEWKRMLDDGFVCHKQGNAVFI